METRLRSYIESLFADAPATRKNVELKEELLQNINEKYHDLISEGKNEESAYNIAVATLGDISPLIDVRAPAEIASDSEALRRRSAILTAIAVMLYILCPVPLILLSTLGFEIIGLVILLVFVAAATGLLIYNNTVNKGQNKFDSTTVEEFREWQQAQSGKTSVFKAISGALWALGTAVYFLISFATGAWNITWIIFLITGAVESIIKAVFDLRK